MDKVLLFCPTHDDPFKDPVDLAIWPDTLESIDALEFHGQLDRVISTDNPYGYGDKKNVLHQYEKAREMTLDGGYDALLTFEHDMIAPRDGLEKLWNTGAPVAYGVYYFRHLSIVLNTLRDVFSKFPDMSMSIFPDDLKRAWNMVVAPVSGAGFGFTLMRRAVLEQIPFRRADSGHPVPDMPFAQDCMKEGIKQVAHFEVLCGHIQPNGEILWPDRENSATMNAVKIVILKDFNASNGKSYKEGDEDTMPEDMAKEYQRAAYLRILNKTAVKVVNKPKRKVKAVK